MEFFAFIKHSFFFLLHIYHNILQPIAFVVLFVYALVISGNLFKISDDDTKPKKKNTKKK